MPADAFLPQENGLPDSSPDSSTTGLSNGLPNGLRADPATTCRLPFAYLKKHGILPLRDATDRLLLGVSDSGGLALAQEIGLLLEERVCGCVQLAAETVLAEVNRAFGESDHADGSVAEMLGDASLDELADMNAEQTVKELLDESSEAPFIRLVNMLLAQAVRAGASDIHIEPFREHTTVRFRLDGVLYERHRLPKRHHPALVSRIKIMAKLNIAEKRLPQDGRIAVSLGGREVGLRVSSLPTAFGERLVLRLLEKSERVLCLTELGLEDHDLAHMRSLLKATHGIILVTGPTGSGKTTSLYAVLQEILSPEKNILTIEDPVEYELDGVGQMQVNPRIGLHFADGLRSIVRQDPDVILIGEIRDTETAAIAVQSALTGHLVFSTLHTNDAPSAVTRLLDMGVEPFLLASVLRAVLAQRLVRVLCPHCRRPASPEELLPWQTELRVFEQPGQIFAPVGCPQCMGTGYRGRMAIYEIMPTDAALKREIVSRTDSGDIRDRLLRSGMRSLRRDGLSKALRGLTSLAEVSRAAME